ncbi:hypothetical protein G195_001048 [Phytophthora kernoviae 00238/432]|uniref:ABC transporter domain-containing protein n=1 Tax=Phytophthora kernoviae 00238/432 TaxID=1284355 RepID=A0A8J4SSX7_9STRA|nr:hypothetical protein G195_001048 [Phytophthora kernoviae 00238/432]
MIEVRNISKQFKVHQALNDVSFTVEQGSVTGLIGPNGSGKTTLIRIMNGVLGASGGQVSINGLDPFRETENVLAICGTLTEQSGLYENMSGRDNLIFFAEAFGVQHAKARIDELVDLFEMEDYQHRKVGTYSTVMASSILTANSFAGEKERKTLEGLLFTPMSMDTLFKGKVLAALIPSLILSWVTFIIYGIIANILMYPMFGALMFPNLNWIILVLWVVPACSLVVILLNVLISAKVRGFQEAYQLGGLVVIPLLALIGGQASGMLLISPLMLILVGAVLLLISFALLRLVTLWNSRQQLAESQI